MKRPFWMHQLVEYVVAVLLLSQGLRSPQPAIPALVGFIVLVNAATGKGSLAAFQLVPRPIHRILDGVVVVIAGLTALLPSSVIDSATRFVLVGSAVVLAFVALRTDYREQPSRRERRAAARSVGGARTPVPSVGTPVDEPSTPAPTRSRPARPVSSTTGLDSEQLGRAAGRAAGRLYNAARRRKRS